MKVQIDEDAVPEDETTVAIAIEFDGGKATDAAVYSDAKVNGELEANTVQDIVEIVSEENGD